MQLRFSRAHDVAHGVPKRLQFIRDQGAMALPPEHFGAHDCGARFFGDLQQTVKTILKFPRHHVIGVTSKRGAAPGGVGRIGPRWTSASQFRQMNIFNSRLHQRSGKGLLTELRMTPRTGKTPHVRKRLDPVFLKQADEVLDASDGMSDGPDFGRARVHAHIVV